MTDQPQAPLSRGEALLGIALAAICADEEPDVREDMLAAAELGKLKVFKDKATEGWEDEVEAIWERMEAEGDQGFLRSCAKALPEEEDRLRAYHMAAGITQVDRELHPLEVRFLRDLAEALGLDEDQVKEALEAGWAEGWR